MKTSKGSLWETTKLGKLLVMGSVAFVTTFMILNMVLFAVHVFMMSMKESREPIMWTCDSKGNHEVLVGEDNQQRGQGLTIEEIRKRLYLLHAATGHGPTRHLVQALRRRGVSEDVLREAERFECFSL